MPTYKFDTWFLAKYPDLQAFSVKHQKHKMKDRTLWDWLLREHPDVLDSWRVDAVKVARLPIEQIPYIIKPEKQNRQL